MAIFNFGDIEIYYEVKGNHDAEKTIAFFNGVMASASSWDFYSEVFVNLGFRVVLHDFKGQLMSSTPRWNILRRRSGDEICPSLS